MVDESAGFRDDATIAERLGDAVLGGEDKFTRSLYGVETVKDPELRSAIEMCRDASTGFLKAAREKLEVSTCEVVHHARRGSSLVVELRANGTTLFEVVVDDLYENEGRLLTRDVLQVRVLEPLDDESQKDVPPTA